MKSILNNFSKVPTNAFIFLQSDWRNPCECPIILLCILYRAVGRIPAGAPYIAMYSLQSGWPNPYECLIILLCILYRAVGRIPAGAPPGPLHHGPGVPVCAGADPEDVLSPADFPLAHRHHRNGTDLSLSLLVSVSPLCLSVFYMYVRLFLR